MKRLLSLLFTLTLAASAFSVSFAQETASLKTPAQKSETVHYTVMPTRENPLVDENKYALPAEADENTPSVYAVFPPKYDPRGTALATAVKDQNPFGTCVDFAAAAALEANTLKQGAGTPDTVDYSEHQHAYFSLMTYNGDGIYFSGNDPASPDFSTYAFMDAGKTTGAAINTLSAWFGLADEADIPYLDRDGNINHENAEGDWTLDEAQRGQAAVHLKNADSFQVTHREDGSLNDSVMRLTKSAIKTNGAVTASYYFDMEYDAYAVRAAESGFDLSQSGYYYPHTMPSNNHIVAIVGWDDNYDKSNFIETPAGNGAWIAKNSWSTEYGDAGYFYISYYDYNVNEITAFEADLPDENGLFSYDNNYQYDFLSRASYAAGYLYYSPAAKLANVFTAEGEEILKAFSVTTMQAGVTVDYEVYLNPTDPARPDSGTLKASGTVTPNPGYHTVELDSPVALKDGDVFTVIQTHSLSGKSVCVPAELGAGDHDWGDGDFTVKHIAAANPGESFMWFDDEEKWSDLTEFDTIDINSTVGPISLNFGNAMIKAFTVDVPSLDFGNNAVWLKTLDFNGNEFGEPVYVTDENCSVTLPEGTAAVRLVMRSDAIKNSIGFGMCVSGNGKWYEEINFSEEHEYIIFDAVDVTGQNAHRFSVFLGNNRSERWIEFTVGCVSQVDALGIKSEGGTAYIGSTVMAVNTNHDIATDEEYVKQDATGAKAGETPTFISFDGSEGAETAPNVADGMLDASFDDSGEKIVLPENVTPTQHTVGEKKSIYVSLYDAYIPMVCVYIGEHSTVWLRDLDAAAPEAVQNETAQSGEAVSEDAAALEELPATEDAATTEEQPAEAEQTQSESAPSVADYTVLEYEITPEQIAAAFDSIYETEVVSFGSPLSIDVDGDGKVALMVDLRDDVNALGYFWSFDLVLNEMDMIHLPERYMAENNLTGFNFVTAHELQHIINYAVAGDGRESWLNEVFAQSAAVVCGLPYSKNDVPINWMEWFIEDKGYSLPFVFSGFYTYRGNVLDDIDPDEAQGVYGQWYLFGQYIAGITDGLVGGGNDIYGTVLKSGSCTAEALTNILYQMGVLDSDYANGGFETLLKNYNLALFLQQESGAYSFNGRNTLGFCWQGVLSTIPATLRGGGSAAFAQSSEGYFTPSEERSDKMVYAGLGITAVNLPPVTPDIASGEATRPVVGNVTIGQKLALTVADGLTIRYTVSLDGTLPAEPTLLSPEYTVPIEITQNTILRVATFDTQNHRSAAVQTLYYYAAPQPVTASAPSGNVTTGTLVELTSATSGAAILYTTDGTEPSIGNNGTIYSAPIAITATTQIRAIAYMPTAQDTTCTTIPTSWNYTISTQNIPTTPETPTIPANTSIPNTSDPTPIAPITFILILSAASIAILTTKKHKLNTK